jgi:hypothetical protein
METVSITARIAYSIMQKSREELIEMPARREDEAEERLRLWHDPPPPDDVRDPRDEERDHLGR